MVLCACVMFFVSCYDTGYKAGYRAAQATVQTARSIPAETESASNAVYISKSGIIHSRSDCSGMKYYTEMSYSDAAAAGCRKCSKCW